VTISAFPIPRKSIVPALANDGTTEMNDAKSKQLMRTPQQ